MKNFSEIITPNKDQSGEWIELKSPDELWDTVNVHLRPGYLIQFQDNRDQSFKTTGEILSKGSLIIVANRDVDGHASGKIFLDHGETLSELENKEYEYYDM